MGLFVAMGYAGTTVSYVFMGQLLNAVESWQAAYLVTALVALAGLVPALLLMLGRGAERPDAAPDRPAAPAGWRLDLSVLRNRPAVLAIAGYTLHTAELYLARLWLPLLLGAMFLQSGAETQEAAASGIDVGGPDVHDGRRRRARGRVRIRLHGPNGRCDAYIRRERRVLVHHRLANRRAARADARDRLRLRAVHGRPTRRSTQRR